jgi:hypothetical protein
MANFDTSAINVVWANRRKRLGMSRWYGSSPAPRIRRFALPWMTWRLIAVVLGQFYFGQEMILE